MKKKEKKEKEIPQKFEADYKTTQVSGTWEKVLGG